MALEYNAFSSREEIILKDFAKGISLLISATQLINIHPPYLMVTLH